MGCSKCGGSGWIKTSSNVTCPCCNGKGKMPNKDMCTKCNGVKFITVTSQKACQYCDGPNKDHA